MKVLKRLRCWCCLFIGSFVAYLAIASTAVAEDTMICPLAYIASKGPDGAIYRPYATEDVVGSHLVGKTTDNPAELRAYVTVANNRLYVYSNYKSRHGFPVKIMTDRTDVGLATLARNLVSIDTTGFQKAFQQMTFFVDERLPEDKQFGHLNHDGAKTQPVSAFATDTVVARFVEGQINLVFPEGEAIPVRGLAKQIVNNNGRLPGELGEYEGKTWLIDTSSLDDDQMVDLTRKVLQIDGAARKVEGKGLRVIYTSNPKLARSRILSRFDGDRVIIRNDDGLLKANLGGIAKRIILRTYPKTRREPC